MKNMLKSKLLMGVLVFMLLITYMSASYTKKLEVKNASMEQEFAQINIK